MSLVTKLDEEKITEKTCNHFLINEYKGPIGIMPHTDGPLYHPYVCIVSLGSSILFHFFEDFQAFDCDFSSETLLVEEGSLFIFSQEYYTNMLHCIKEVGFESFGMYVRIVKNAATSKYSAVVDEKQMIANLLQTKIFQERLKPPFEAAEGNQFKDRNSEVEVIKALISEFDKKTFEKYQIDVVPDLEAPEFVKIVVGWARNLRLSLTIRYVYPAPAP